LSRLKPATAASCAGASSSINSAFAFRRALYGHQPNSATRSDEKEACERKIKIDSLFLIDLCSQRRILLQQLLFLFLCRPLFLEQRLQDLVVSFLSEEMKIDDCAQNLSEPCRIRCGQVFDREIVDATCVEELRATDHEEVSERAEGK